MPNDEKFPQTVPGRLNSVGDPGQFDRGFVAVALVSFILVLTPLSIIFGAVQLLFSVPFALIAKYKYGATRTAQGAFVAAGLAFLINAGCFGLFAFGVFRIPH